MQPIFTIHAGEYLVADYIERHYGNSHHLRVWVPSKDDGIDLLVTDDKCRNAVSLQVKYSKSYDCKSEYDASGWWKLNREKIEKSKADYWVFVMPEFLGKKKVSSCCFVILTPKELIKRLMLIHEKNHEKDKPYNMYLTVKGDVAIETRGANMADRNMLFAEPTGHRDFSCFLNRWGDVLSRVCSKKV